MRAHLLAALVTLSLIPACGGGIRGIFGSQPAPLGREAYELDESKIPVGVVYHYVKSNTDGSKPERVSLYMPSRDQLESFKFKEPRPESAAHVTATMDWTRFFATHLESRVMSRGGQERAVAVAEYTPIPPSLSVELGDSLRHTISIKQLPLHIYSFDLASLNVSLRHMKDPEAQIVFGLANPTYQTTGAVFEYLGAVTMSYVGAEDRDITPCDKYRVEGKGLHGRSGFLWLDRDERHIVDLEITAPNHPDWVTFKLKLLSKQSMTPAEWQTFMRSQLEG